MKTLFSKHQKRITEDLGEQVAQARKIGLEAGWTGSNNWSPQLTQSISTELRVKEKHLHGEFGPEPAVLVKKIDTLRERKEQLDSLLASHREECLKAGRSSGEVQRQWDLRRLVTIAALVGLAGVTVSIATPNTPWQAFVALALVGVLIGLRPWGVMPSIRLSLLRAEGDFTYFLSSFRSWRLARQLDELQDEIHREERRRERAERWVAERLDSIFSHYQLQKTRGEKARLIEAQG